MVEFVRFKELLLFSIFPLYLLDVVEWRSNVDMLVDVEAGVFGRKPIVRMPRFHYEKVSYLYCHVSAFSRKSIWQNGTDGEIGLNSHVFQGLWWCFNLPNFFWNATRTLLLKTKMKKTRTPCKRLKVSDTTQIFGMLSKSVAKISNSHEMPITMNSFRFIRNLKKQAIKVNSNNRNWISMSTYIALSAMYRFFFCSQLSVICILWISDFTRLQWIAVMTKRTKLIDIWHPTGTRKNITCPGDEFSVNETICLWLLLGYREKLYNKKISYQTSMMKLRC